MARKLAFAALVAAVYATLTIALSFISYGPVQFRVAEALCVLPFLFPFSVWGLFVGCILSNLISPYPLDIAVGAAATLLAALCTMGLGRIGPKRISAKILACLPPVIINAVFIGALIGYYMVSAGEASVFLPAFVVNGLQVGLGELAVMYLLGLPLLIFLSKSKLFSQLTNGGLIK